MEPRGIGGGLCVFWKEDARIALVKNDSFFIELGFGDDRDYTDEKRKSYQWRKLGKRRSYSAGKCLLMTLSMMKKRKGQVLDHQEGFFRIHDRGKFISAEI